MTLSSTRSNQRVRRVFDCLWKAGLSVNFAKCLFCAPQQEFVGMLVDNLRVRPSQSKIDAVAQLSRATTVEQVRSLLGTTGYLRRFVPKYSELAAPVSDLLRDKRCQSKRARKKRIPCGKEHDQVLAALLQALISPPILAAPNWKLPFQTHTDASEMGAEAALTQSSDGSERVMSYASHRWSATDGKKSATEREVMAVLWAVVYFRPYLWGRKFTLVPDCSALTRLFRSQTLSSKLHRWALRLSEYHMDLQWRPGSRHQLPAALSTLPRFDSPSNDTDDSFPDDASRACAYRGPGGPVLDGIPLIQLGVNAVENPET